MEASQWCWWWPVQTTCNMQHWSLTAGLGLSRAKLPVLPLFCGYTQSYNSCLGSCSTLVLAPAVSLSHSFSRHLFMFTFTVERESPYRSKFCNIWTNVVLGIIEVNLKEKLQTINLFSAPCTSFSPLLMSGALQCNSYGKQFCMRSFTELRCFKIIKS